MQGFLAWFKSDGDKLCNFVSLSALALQGITGLSSSAMTAFVTLGVLATAAHQSFFPNSPQENPK